jgi:hypothetical protein
LPCFLGCQAFGTVATLTEPLRLGSTALLYLPLTSVFDGDIAAI